MRILILGGTGMLGHALWQCLSPSIRDTFVTVRQSRKKYEGFGLFTSDNVIDSIDVNNFLDLTDVLQHIKPDFILNCIGITKRRHESELAVPTIHLNALFPHQLSEWGVIHSARVINFSTDCVFDGGVGNYTEESVPNAIDLYGKTKALGEIRGKNALTLRSSFIGTELDGGTELLEWFLSQKGTVKGFRNAIYSGLTTIELGRIVKFVLLHHPNISGLYNISSDPISKFDLLTLIKKKLRLNVKVIPDETISCNRSLNSSKFRNEFKYSPPTWDAMIEELCMNIMKRGDRV